MPIDLSSRKVRVTKTYQTDSVVGLISAQVNQRVRYGIQTRWIVSHHPDQTQVRLAAASGGTAIETAYPHDLVMDYATASGSWGFPSSSGSVSFGHHSASFFGTPPASGVSYANSDGIHTFGL
jgi:hypothetical protein